MAKIKPSTWAPDVDAILKSDGFVIFGCLINTLWLTALLPVEPLLRAFCAMGLDTFLLALAISDDFEAMAKLNKKRVKRKNSTFKIRHRNLFPIILCD